MQTFNPQVALSRLGALVWMLECRGAHSMVPSVRGQTPGADNGNDSYNLSPYFQGKVSNDTDLIHLEPLYDDLRPLIDHEA